MCDAAKPRRGRPPTINNTRIVQAGIELTLPAITLAGVARHLGVTQAALYKHVDSLHTLRQLVAEEIFTRWQIPATDPTTATLHEYLLEFGISIRALAHHYPGISEFLTRRGGATPDMVTKIEAHHTEVARAYHLPAPATRWLLSTIAFHCVALADTIYASYQDAASRDAASRDAAAAEPATGHPHTGLPNDAIEEDFLWGLKSLILGALQVAGLTPTPTPERPIGLGHQWSLPG